MTLFAVHISDGVLTWPWLVGGFAGAAILLFLAAWRLRDEEIPRIGVLTAAFFVSSLIHIRVPPISIHLLLTGLVGVVLGRRAPLAIAVGLVLQVLLMEHGGRWSLGVNICVMTIPALLCAALFHALHRVHAFKTPVGRAFLVGSGAVVLFMTATYSVTLLMNTSLTTLDDVALQMANARLVDPWIVGGAIAFAAVAVIVERRLENTPEFPLGFLIGELSVLGTVVLDCVVLIAGGEQMPTQMALGLVIVHLPFAVVEGVILGFVVGFLARAKPELLRTSIHPPETKAMASSTEIQVAPGNR